MSAFPTISFQPFITGSEEEKLAVAHSIYDAFHNYGWVYLKDFGISTEKIDEMFRHSKLYFDQPMKEKLKHELQPAIFSQGYTPDGAETYLNKGIDHKECYEHRRFQNTLCPEPTKLEGFKVFMDEFYKECYTLCIQVLRALALVMGLESKFFDSAMKLADPQLRLIHYMPISHETVSSPGHASIIPHTDFGLCTILFQDSVGGLEVDPFHTGDFVPATPVPGTCIINVADLLQRLSNDRLKSTLHRVVSPPMTKETLYAMGPDDLLPGRYSTAFFVHPSADVMIHTVPAEGEKVKYDSINAGEWRKQMTAKNYAIVESTA